MSSAADSLFNAYLVRVENSSRFPNRYSSVPKDARGYRHQIHSGRIGPDREQNYMREGAHRRAQFRAQQIQPHDPSQEAAGLSIKPIYYHHRGGKGLPSGQVCRTPHHHRQLVTQEFRRHLSRQYPHARSLQWSYNTAVRCANDIGLPAVRDAFRRFGLKSDPKDLTAALGAYE